MVELYLGAVLGSVRTGRFEAGQHLQQVEERGEVGLLQEQQHGDVLLLRRRQTRGRQLDPLALPLSPRSTQRHEHHLTQEENGVLTDSFFHIALRYVCVAGHLHVFKAELMKSLLIVVSGQLVPG